MNDKTRQTDQLAQYLLIQFRVLVRRNSAFQHKILSSPHRDAAGLRPDTQVHRPYRCEPSIRTGARVFHDRLRQPYNTLTCLTTTSYINPSPNTIQVSDKSYHFSGHWFTSQNCEPNVNIAKPQRRADLGKRANCSPRGSGHVTRLNVSQLTRASVGKYNAEVRKQMPKTLRCW